MLSLVIVGALLSTAVIPAQANNDAMMNLLKILRDKGTITAQDYELLANAAKADKEATDATEAKVEKVAKKADEAPKVSLKGGHLKIKSNDGDFSTQIGGRIMLDAAAFRSDLGDETGSEVRRARIFVKGKMYKDWDYKAQIGYAGNLISMKDMYISYNAWEPARIRFGNHHMPLGLEQQTSSKYITFMERSIVSDAQDGAGEAGRAMGITSFSHGDNWTLGLGAHLEGTSKNLAFEENEDWGVGGRVTFAPIAEKTKNIHLGAAYHYQSYENDGKELGVSFRPEAHLSPVKPFTTGNVGQLDDGLSIGLEAAGVWGPFSAQSEYTYFDMNSSNNSTKGDDPNFNTWYVYGSYFLTGESRSYSAKKGNFGRVKPKEIVGQGGSGAWELALRYSYADLENKSSFGATGNKGDVSTIGLNWYATPNIRFMANYNWTAVDNNNLTKEDVDGNVFQMRGQIDF